MMNEKQTVLTHTDLYLPAEFLTLALDHVQRNKNSDLHWSANFATPSPFTTQNVNVTTSKHEHFLKIQLDKLQFNFKNDIYSCFVDNFVQVSVEEPSEPVFEPVIDNVSGTVSDTDGSFGCPFSVETLNSETTSKKIDLIIEEMSDGDACTSIENAASSKNVEQRKEVENTDSLLGKRKRGRRKKDKRMPILSKEKCFTNERKECLTSETEDVEMKSPSVSVEIRSPVEMKSPSVSVEIRSPSVSILSVESEPTSTSPSSGRYCLRGKKIDPKIMNAEKGIFNSTDTTDELNSTHNSTRSLGEFTDDTEIYSDSDYEYDKDQESFTEFSTASDETKEKDKNDTNIKKNVNRVKNKACKLCKYKGYEYFLVYEHVKKMHSEAEGFEEYLKELETLKIARCETCNIDFANPKKLQKHVEVLEHMNNGLSCVRCGQSFKTETSLILHIRNAHQRNPGKTALCEFCSATYSSVNALKQHMESVHQDNKSFTCESCDKTFFNNSQLRRHIRIHGFDEIKRIKCDACDKTFLHNHNLKRHMEMVHTQQSEKFHCSYCGKGYTQKGAMISHVQLVHFNLFPFVCKECKTNFTKSRFLLEHMISVHKQTGVKIEDSSRNRIYGKTDEEKFYCAFCNEGFLHKIRLIEHVHLDHSKMFPFICDKCNQGFISSAYLALHSLKAHGYMMQVDGELPLTALGTGDIVQILSTKSGYPTTVTQSANDEETGHVVSIADSDSQWVISAGEESMIDPAVTSSSSSTLLVEVASDTNTLQYVIETPGTLGESGSVSVAKDIANLLIAAEHTIQEDMEVNGSAEDSMTTVEEEKQNAVSRTSELQGESIEFSTDMEVTQATNSVLHLNTPMTSTNIASSSTEQNIFSKFTVPGVIVEEPFSNTTISTDSCNDEKEQDHFEKILSSCGFRRSRRSKTTTSVRHSTPKKSGEKLTPSTSHVTDESANSRNLDLLDMAMETVVMVTEDSEEKEGQGDTSQYMY